MRMAPLAFTVALAACNDAPTQPSGDGDASGLGTGTASTGTKPSDPSPPGTEPPPTSGTESESGKPADSTTDDGDSGSIEPEDPRQTLLETYAPRIWFTADEAYFPSSVEWAFPSLERFVGSGGEHWVRTIEPLDSPSDTLPFFAGDLETAPVYAYWAEKKGGIVDLVYFVYSPYNRGKEVVDTIWGNHVGDWEHITVRLIEKAEDEYEPSQVYLSAHSFGGAYDWDSGEVELFDGTHPVVYTANGSHGFWAQPGDHAYVSIGEEDPLFGVCITIVCVDLIDETAADLAWDTWESVYGMDFFAQEGLDGRPWPAWMSDDFTNPGMGAPTLPEAGAIVRWGNPEDCSVLGLGVDITDLIGVCRLEDGPTGPVSKGTWGEALR
ncbi:MAG: Vps62-related protein [Myxococcota bacterium]